MNILGKVAVYPTPHDPIARLSELAYNLWWSWHPEAQALYEEIDPDLWKSKNHNPVLFLREVSQRRLQRAAEDADYVARYNAVMADFDAYMQPESTWFRRNYPAATDRLIAYFSAEFGLHESLPIYSGGLGILAGDHCKAASDMGLPFVGVGFLYPQGYFQQRIDGEGRQHAFYQKLDFNDVPALPAQTPDGQHVMVSVDLPGRTVYAKVWRIQVGRIPVFLMDTDVEQNAPADRELAARLYGGNQEIRVSQEFVLGIGGVRTLRALGLRPTVWHINEGHAAFLQIERIREYVAEEGLDFNAARWAARTSAVFTTHTPVPAGNDSFPFSLMERFFEEYWKALGQPWDRFLDLGRYDYGWGSQFSMTVLALRTCGWANGVSELHGAVSRRIWHSLWPQLPLPEAPIGHVTNGIHTESWLDPGLRELFDRYLGPNWTEELDDSAVWARAREIPDVELWRQHAVAKQLMVDMVRQRSVEQLQRVKAVPSRITAAAVSLDPKALTIGFARRFATYKRAALIFRDQERLKRILNNPERPVQIVFAGKAHPADEPGKALIQQVYQLSQQPGFEGRIVFLEGYNINMARHLVAGVDVWLNNPRKPLEASGTSGQKAGLNGVPNLSILDGWWAEGYNGENGWAIDAGQEYGDEGAQDEADALALYQVLETEVIPLFYERDSDGMPRAWLNMMRESIATVGQQFAMVRTLRDYTQSYYRPANALYLSVSENNYAQARSLAEWEKRIRAGWSSVSLSATTDGTSALSVNQSLPVQARLQSGALDPSDLAVELVYGREQGGELLDAQVCPMHPTGQEDGRLSYAVDFASPESGVFAYGVRVRPHHVALSNPLGLGLIRWADEE